MKALIFNSGMGSRLGKLTENNPKCLISLGNGESILERQLRILAACGIDEFVITVGPFQEKICERVSYFTNNGCTIHLIENSLYSHTNYIYSMHLARELLVDDDFLILHGDLVFDIGLAKSIIESECASLGTVMLDAPLSKKDFNARISNGYIDEVGVGISGADCVAFQPFYRLSSASMKIWLDVVERYIDAGVKDVYAETAANEVFSSMRIAPFDCSGHVVCEIDTPEDLEYAQSSIRLMDFKQQPVFLASGNLLKLEEGVFNDVPDDGFTLGALFQNVGFAHPLVISGRHFKQFFVKSALDESRIQYSLFDEYSPNPTLEESTAAAQAFFREGCDSLISVGGGSSIDLAKSVKSIVGKSWQEDSSLKTKFRGRLLHMAVPTTAGTGSESTSFAACYVAGRKVSLSDDSLLPDIVVLDPSTLTSLGDYQKKCTVLDALCQAIESYWSVNSCEESRRYSVDAIRSIMANVDLYVAGRETAGKPMMLAANASGKAINLTTTTAAHAMSYKLTTMYGVPHGHAVSMCMPYVWKSLLKWDDPQTQARLKAIAQLVCENESATAEHGLMAFIELRDRLGLSSGVCGDVDDLQELVASVNAERLLNFPKRMSDEELYGIYKAIIGV